MQMPSTNGCFPLSSKHFLITTWNGVFGIINEKGEVENKNSFWKDSVNFQCFRPHLLHELYISTCHN